MSAASVADVVAFEALPDDVQALARRVCVDASDEVCDAHVDEGVSIGRREEAEQWHTAIRHILQCAATAREAMLLNLLRVEALAQRTTAVSP